jgi:hypothetical protein
MKKVKCFIKDESTSHPGKYIIRPIHENFHLNSTEGSFNIICARLMGLTYAQYLRMCRDCFDAEIMGKDSMYPVAYFKRSKKMDDLIDNLNARANMVLWEREHPNFEEHAAYVKEHNPRYYAEVTNHVSDS